MWSASLVPYCVKRLEMMGIIDGFEALLFGITGDGVLHKVAMREQGMWIAIIAFDLVHHPLA